MTWFWRLSVLGWIASAAWHLALRFDYVPGSWWMPGLLLGGLALVWLPAVLKMGRTRIDGGGRGRWVVAAVCLLYAFINMWLVLGAIERRPALALSGHLIAFYAFAAAVLWPSRTPPGRRWQELSLRGETK